MKGDDKDKSGFSRRKREELNTIALYVQKRVALENKAKELGDAARTAELNNFETLTLQNDSESEESDVVREWTAGPNKRQRREFKTKNASYKTLDQCINDSYASFKNYLTGHPKKTNKHHKKSDVPPAPIIFIDLVGPEGNNSKTLLKTLLDSGASSSVISSRAVKHLKTDKSESTSFLTMAGTFNTTHTCSTEFQIPELNQSAKIASTFHVTQMKGNYDVILGRDVLAELGILIDFRYQTVSWNDASIDMKPTDCTQDTSYYAAETGVVAEATSRISKILDAKYSPANLDEIAKENGKLTIKQKDQLLTLLNRHKPLFDGTLGRWHGDPYQIELRENAKPHHANPYSIPQAYEATLKMEVERLCKVGVLKKINRSEWAAPTFIIPKKDRTVRFISDFRELNKRIKRKPFPIPKIQDLLLKLENFQYATSLDLNMVYYHKELAPESKRLCTIVLPWGKYKYQKLPMGLCNSLDIFQEKMNKLFAGLDFVRAYIDSLLIISKR